MNEKQIIANLHEQLSLWLKASTKKNKHQVYLETVKTLADAEQYLEQKA